MIPTDLAAAADENFVLHVSRPASRTAGMEVRAEPDLVLADSHLASDTFNCVCRARLDPAGAAARIAGAIQHFRDAGRPFSWWVSPGDRPTDLGRRLIDAGLAPTEAELAMAASLDRLTDDDRAPAGLEIRRATTASALQDFARVAAANWSPPDQNVVRYYTLTTPALLAPGAPQRFYVGYLDGEPVATAELTVGGGVVGLYNIATAAGHRHRGFGTAITLRPLDDARAEGHRTAVLQAAQEGIGLYRRIGFAPFGDLTEYQPPAR